MGTGTFMHQARYETDLHDAEVDLAIPKVPGVAERGLSQAQGSGEKDWKTKSARDSLLRGSNMLRDLSNMLKSGEWH